MNFFSLFYIWIFKKKKLVIKSIFQNTLSEPIIIIIIMITISFCNTNKKKEKRNRKGWGGGC